MSTVYETLLDVSFVLVPVEVSNKEEEQSSSAMFLRGVINIVDNTI